jgi:NAD(P)-dependent dehydrogenase (short-subunit alcohol dehydrogenase family)
VELRFDNKVVLITGGTKGIGKGIAQKFLELGAQVVVCARHEPEKPPRWNDNIAEYRFGNVRDPESIDELVDDIQEEFGQLDVVVNNAGGSPEVDAATVSPRFTSAIIDLNLTAVFHVSQAANRVMQEQDDGGVIINIASVSGVRPSPGTAAYGAAKAGVLSLTQSLAIEWAPKVRMNAVTAGLIRTKQSEEHYGGPEGVARVAETVPLGRLGTPEDISDACVYLASDLASYATGAEIRLDGGGEKPAFLGAAKDD